MGIACSIMQQLLQMQALQLTILVGTMTGTAQLVAQELELTLGDADTAVKVLPMDGLDASIFSSDCLFLICSSTYGQGDVPDNAKALYASLQSARPELSRVRYGVFALGDRTYAETFCNGGRRFDDVLLHDASAGTMPEEVAVGWAPGWLALCREKLREAA